MAFLETSALQVEIERLCLSAKIPGCSVAVVGESGLIWSNGFGFADLEEMRPATARTVYHLFSGTKLFTAVAVLQLVERGLVDIDNPVTTYLPEFNELSRVRVVHLLSHRSGLKDALRGFMSFYFPPEAPPSTMEALAHYPIVGARPPGQRVEYRNVNYALLGEIITRVSGMEYTDFVRHNVLAPLGMEAGFALTDTMRPLAASGYMGRWDPTHLVMRFVVPDVARRIYRGRIGSRLVLKECGAASAAIGGLVGDVVEFARFLRSQLVGGDGVLSRQSTELMQTMQATGKPGIESRDGIGLGWKFGTAQNGRFLNHEGAGPGFTSELRLYPKQGAGIALAMNVMRMPRANRAAHHICEAVMTGEVSGD
jgi:CubicO group peptidase (beta-lactamase class C family)